MTAFGNPTDIAQDILSRLGYESAKVLARKRIKQAHARHRVDTMLFWATVVNKVDKLARSGRVR